MAFTTKTNAGTETRGHGLTLFVGLKTYRVMSDVYEDGSFARVWNPETQAIETIDWIESGTVDATPETITVAKAYVYKMRYLHSLKTRLEDAQEAATRIIKDCQVKVFKGRKFPIGMTGKVVGFSDSRFSRNVGIAIDDEMIEVERYGRKFLNHKNVSWVDIKNVKRIDCTPIDMDAIEEAARNAAQYRVDQIDWMRDGFRCDM